ncbi:MAG: hypothetical protein KF893_07710 [Caldilineaceae bacterium]|nr:hypothetical protein [Caldilineaceae bacterium]
MHENRSSLSQAASYEEMGEFWDTHSLDEFWEQTESVEFDIDFQPQSFRFALDSKLAEKAQQIAKHRGISTQTLLNLWIQEKVQEDQIQENVATN